MEIALGIVILVVAVVLIVSVLLQTGKDKQLSGSIAGVSDSYLGKNRARKMDKIWNMITIISSIVFVILSVVMYFVVNA